MIGNEWLVLSTGRCGSTAISELIKCGTDITSLSELLASLQPLPDHHLECTGDAAWELASAPRKFMTTLTGAHAEPEEFLYRFREDSPWSRQSGLPPLCVTTLPHLVGDETDRFLDELEKDVRALPARPIAVQLQAIARIIARRYGRADLAERSGGSCGYIPSLSRAGLMPEARLIHVYRNPIDTAVSMMHHSAIRLTHARYLQIVLFGEDFYADRVGGFLCTIRPELARFIVGGTYVPSPTRRELAALHPDNFDPLALWRIRLPMELFMRSWSLMCAAAEPFLRSQPALHVCFDRVTSGDADAELEPLGAELGADPDRWAAAVNRTIRNRRREPFLGSPILHEMGLGTAALHRLLADARFRRGNNWPLSGIHNWPTSGEAIGDFDIANVVA